MAAIATTQFVLEATGSRGDVAPLLSLAGALQRHDHAVHLIAPVAFEAEALALGCRFVANSSRSTHFLPGEGVKFEDYVYPGAEAVERHVAELLEQGEHVVIVNIDRTCATNLMAARYGLPCARIHLSPFKIDSDAVSPVSPTQLRIPGALGAAFLKYTLPRLRDAADRDERLLGYVNARRLHLGLDAVTHMRAADAPLDLELGMFPEWFCPRGADWPARLELLDFPLGTSQPLPAELERFLADGDAPLVFTFGTGATSMPHVLPLAEACCERLGRRGVLLSRDAKGASGRVLSLPFADLRTLLPRAAAFFHHGGIGGTARALEAGVPQVLSPRGFDQPDNAARVVRLGVGKIVPLHEQEVDAMVGAARELMTSEQCRAALQAVRKRFTHGGVAEASASAQLLALAERRGSSAHPRPSRSSKTDRSVVFLVWPEPGHLTAPLSLARRLRARGTRVSFAGIELAQRDVQSAGFAFFALAPLERSGRGLDSVLWTWSGERSLKDAVKELIARFRELVERSRPGLVLVDSLYSTLAALPAAHAVQWACYETDLPRELDPEVPPLGSRLVPDGSTEVRRALRAEWAALLSATRKSRRELTRRVGAAGGWSMATGFPDALAAELRRQLAHPGPALKRAAIMAPVARGRRLIFWPRTLDFARSRTDGLHWADTAVDLDRGEPAMDWSKIPRDRRLIYCSLGTRALRSPAAMMVLRTAMAALSRHEDVFLVVACDRHHARALPEPDPERCVVLERAPQLALLRRASAMITHGGFNSVKECISLGVPMVVVPLSHDQPRNGALVERLGLGLSLPLTRCSQAVLEEAISAVTTSERIRRRCRRYARLLSKDRDRSVQLVESWLHDAASAHVLSRSESASTPKAGDTERPLRLDPDKREREKHHGEHTDDQRSPVRFTGRTRAL